MNINKKRKKFLNMNGMTARALYGVDIVIVDSSRSDSRVMEILA